MKYHIIIFKTRPVTEGQTITSSYFKGLTKFKQLFPDNLAWDSLLIYGGEEVQQRSDTRVISIFSLADFLRDL